MLGAAAVVDELSISWPGRAPLQKRLLRHKRGNCDSSRNNSRLATGKVQTLADGPTGRLCLNQRARCQELAARCGKQTLAA